MKILNWKKFNESLKSDKITIKIPIAVCKNPTDDMFSGNMNNIVNKLNDAGFDGALFEKEFDEWYERNCPEKPGHEPDRDDYDDEDDYNSDLENWEDNAAEYSNFNSDEDSLIDKFIDNHYGGMFELKSSFRIFDVIDNVCDNEEKKKIFKSLCKFLNNNAFIDDLEEELIDVNERWNKNDEYTNFDSYFIEIVGDNFQDDYLVIQIGDDVNLSRLSEKIYFWINNAYVEIINMNVTELENIDVHIYWYTHIKEEYKVVFPEIESYEYQKEFLTETPEDYKLLEPFGINPKIKEEFDYLWSGGNMGLI